MFLHVPQKLPFLERCSMVQVILDSEAERSSILISPVLNLLACFAYKTREDQRSGTHSGSRALFGRAG